MGLSHRLAGAGTERGHTQCACRAEPGRDESVEWSSVGQAQPGSLPGARGLGTPGASGSDGLGACSYAVRARARTGNVRRWGSPTTS